ncbi:MAG: peptidylprolyl isomerase [Bacteroidales bacterium]|nr:peptidylprolyl isomerase [Clostridium sp.]MCM1203723.1 peptidylprolyl isomerase [Bacteroidales bacterium]
MKCRLGERQWRKWLLAEMFLSLCLLLTACGGSGKWVFSLNGEKVYRKQAAVFGLIYAREYNLNDKKQLDEEYGDGETYGEHYKNEVKEEILSSVLLYSEAKEKGYALSEQQRQTVKEEAEKLLASCEKKWLKQQKIKAADVEKVYEWKLLSDSYLEDISEGEDEGAEKDSHQNERYVQVYEVLFPTVEIGEDGMIQSDSDGTVKEISTAEKNKKRGEAEELSKQGQEGKDIGTLAEKYASSAIGMEKTLNYQDLDSAYKQAVDKLSQGGTSNVFETDYGFLVIRLLNADDVEHAEAVGAYEDREAARKKRDTVLDGLFEKYVRDDRDYIHKENWEQIEMAEFLP